MATENKSEKSVQNEILREFGTRTDMRVWRQNTGVGFYRGRAVRFGVPGQADITGILQDGTRIEIEVKKKTGRQTTQQRRWQKIIEQFNGIYVIAKCVEDVKSAIDLHYSGKMT